MFVFRTILWGTAFLFISLIAGPWFALQFDSSFPALALGAYRYLGFVPFTIGTALAIYCTAIIVLPGQSRPAPYDAGGVFSVAGPYRYSRNPFLLGVILALWGEALITSRIVMFAYAFIFTWSIHFWVVFIEEPSLQDSFGGEYRAYRNAVPRWIPQFKRYDEGRDQ